MICLILNKIDRCAPPPPFQLSNLYLSILHFCNIADSGQIINVRELFKNDATKSGLFLSISLCYKTINCKYMLTLVFQRFPVLGEVSFCVRTLPNR